MALLIIPDVYFQIKPSEIV